MIYLIGGPPKCGKTTLAKYLLKEKGIPWVSTDTLQNIVKAYTKEKDFVKLFPSSVQRCDTNDEKFSKFPSDEIINAYRVQARTIWDAIYMFVVSEITDENDFVIEGYHIEPEFIAKLNNEYKDKIQSIFLIKKDEVKFVENIKESSTLNDWIVENTKESETYNKIAKMISEYSEIFEKEAQKYNLDIINMDDDFDRKIKTMFNKIDKII